MNAPVTRRALLGATAALGAMALPAMAEAGLPAPHPDAELLDLIARHAEAWDACERAEAEATRVDALARAAEPPKPEALRMRPDDFPRTSMRFPLSRPCEDNETRVYTEDGVTWLRGRPAATWVRTLSPPLGPECEARRVEVLAAWDGWRDEVARVEAALGLPAAEDACAAAAAAYWLVLEALEAWMPRTLDGLRAKAGWVVAYTERGGLDADGAALAFAREVAAFRVMS